MSTFVISDIHGCYYSFKKLLKKIKFNENDTLICLGDAIDRGKNNIQLLDLFMANSNMILLKGNHEFFYQCWVNNLLSEREWWGFGGKPTIQELKTLSKEQILTYYDFIRKLPLYYEINDYVLSHNGFNADFPFIKDDNGIIQVKETIDIQWKTHSYNFIISSDIHFMPKLKLNKKMIVGHTPVLRFGENKIVYSTNCIDIDCGATYKNGCLGCLKLDDMSEYYQNIDSMDLL